MNGVTVDKIGSLVPIQPPRGAAFALNLLLHTFVFFVVLTILFQIVISPLEANTLAREVKQNVQSGLASAMGRVTDPDQVRALKASLPALKTLLALSPSQDQARNAHNNALVMAAWGLAGALGLAFVVSACVLGAARVQLGTTMAHVFAENAILFAILGALEGGFFLAVASKYVPVMPSTLANVAVTSMQDHFPSQKMSQ